jgi:hypothetical protein
MTMETVIGYVLVSKTHQHTWKNCPDCAIRQCHRPDFQELAGIPLCSPERSAVLSKHSTQEHHQLNKLQKAWIERHTLAVPTGGTRLGPRHYFSDCLTLTKRGPRRSDARIVAMNAEALEALDLPLRKQCAARMAPIEALMTQNDKELERSKAEKVG